MDHNAHFEDDGGKFSLRVENTLGKEEIAKKNCPAHTKTHAFIWERVKQFTTTYSLSQTTISVFQVKDEPRVSRL